MASLFVIL
jgi:hypothetical protein